MTQTALSQALIRHAREVTSLGQECDIETQSCPLHLTIDTQRGPVRFTMPFIVSLGRGRCGYHRAEDAERELGIDVMAQLKASVLKAQWRPNGAGMELIARTVGEPNDSAVLRASMAATVFVPGGDAPGDVDDKGALTLPSQRPMIFQHSEVEMRDHVGVLETAPRPNVPRCCAISFFARTLTCHAGRCRVTHLHARSLGRPGFIEGQGWFGRSPHLNVISFGGVRQSRAPTSAR